MRNWFSNLARMLKAKVSTAPREDGVGRRGTGKGDQRSFEVACLNGDEFAVDSALAHGVPNDWLTPALVAAVMNGRNEIVRRLLSAGADANEGPLATPAGKGRFETVSLLLEAGADPNRSTQYGWTPLMAATSNTGAVKYGNTLSEPERVAQLLIERGADVEGRGKNGQTALMEAAKANSVVGIKTLLRFEANVAQKDRQGLTALHYACLRASVFTASELLLAGADPGVADLRGSTPLHYAAGLHFSSFVGYLGRQLDGCGFDDAASQKTLLKLQSNAVNIVRLLLQRGAVREARNSDGLTPAQIAQKEGFDLITKALRE